jgi:hypothetical protein
MSTYQCSQNPPNGDVPDSDDISTAVNIFVFSPFGLSCCHVDCPRKPFIQLEHRSVQMHLKKHGLRCDSFFVKKVVNDFMSMVSDAKKSGQISDFCADQKEYTGFLCDCGDNFTTMRSALRHCTRTSCNSVNLKSIKTIKLCCGRYVTELQLDKFFNDKQVKQWDYTSTRQLLEGILREDEKSQHTYTHMYFPLIQSCGESENFIQKIRNDYLLIHDAPNLISEPLLWQIHERASCWLLNYSQDNILLVPGNFRAALQTYEGGEVNEVNQSSTYVMQHHPKTILPELLKMLSFAYRRGLFFNANFKINCNFAIAYFLKDLLLETPCNVLTLPFVVEFCLMHSFRVIHDGLKEIISMISCDTAASVFSKLFSVCKAGVCSVICSYSQKTFTEHGPSLIKQIRDAPVVHIMGPMLRQLREMHSRIPKRRKTTLDVKGNIIVDNFHFPITTWSQIVQVSLDKLKDCVIACADGIWWEPVVDMFTPITVQTDHISGELFIVGFNEAWHSPMDFDCLNAFGTMMEMTLHGFGGGSARLTELSYPTMLNVIWHNNTVYYKMESIKQFNHASKRQRTIERKLPPIVGRFYLLLRSLVRQQKNFFKNHLLMIPKIDQQQQYTVRHVIRDIFLLGSLPSMTQIRHFWAGITNFVTAERHNDILTANQTAAEKMGHSFATHLNTYSSYLVGGQENLYNLYHSAIGDTSHNLKSKVEVLSIGDLWFAMKSCHPTSDYTKANFLSMAQKELVEFGRGHKDSKMHCVCLLAPGQGKSMSYILPTIARCIAEKEKKMIIHISPYTFLAGYQYHAAKKVIHDQFGLKDTVIETYSGKDINNGKIPEHLTDS